MAMGVLGLIFGLLLTVIIEWRIERDLRSSAHNSLHAIASSIAHRLTEDLSNRHREVALLATLLKSQYLAHDSIEPVIDGLKTRQPVYAWIGLVHHSGIVLAATDGLLRGHSVDSRPWFKHSLLGGFVGDPHEAVLLAPHMKPGRDGEPPRFLDVGVPLVDQNESVVGVMGAHLYWDWVHSVISAVTEKLDRVGALEVLVADQSGNWLFKPHQIDAKNLAELQKNNAHGKYVVATQPVRPVDSTKGLGWTIVVMEDEKWAYAPIKESRNFMLLFATTLAVTFTALTWVVAGRVAQPIIKLARIAQDQVEFSDYAHKSIEDKGTDETRALDVFMNRLAHYDSLTGLSNRKEITGRITKTIERSAVSNSHAALLLLNIDNFGIFNNAKGYEAGDQMLIAVAKRLRWILADGTGLSRINGDEFVIVLDNLAQDSERAIDQAQVMAGKLQNCFNAAFFLEAGKFSVHVSIGIYLIKPEAIRVGDALQYAELAMREAKRLGKNSIAVFTESMQAQLAEKVKFQ